MSFTPNGIPASGPSACVRLHVHPRMDRRLELLDPLQAPFKSALPPVAIGPQPFANVTMRVILRRPRGPAAVSRKMSTGGCAGAKTGAVWMKVGAVCISVPHPMSQYPITRFKRA